MSLENGILSLMHRRMTTSSPSATGPASYQNAAQSDFAGRYDGAFLERGSLSVLPEQRGAAQPDPLQSLVFPLVIGAATVLLVLVFSIVAVFVWRRRRTQQPEVTQEEDSTPAQSQEREVNTVVLPVFVYMNGDACYSEVVRDTRRGSLSLTSADSSRLSCSLELYDSYSSELRAICYGSSPSLNSQSSENTNGTDVGRDIAQGPILV